MAEKTEEILDETLAYREERMNRSTVSSIETFFDGLLRGKLTDNLFFNDLPPQLNKGWKDMVVVDIGNPMRDHEAYTVGTALILLYATQDPYGHKDVATIQKLEKKLNHLILTNNDKHYHLQRRGNYSNYNAVNDIFICTVQISIIIT